MLLTGFERGYLPIVADVQDMKPDEQCHIKRIKYLQSMIHHFRKRWSKEYRTELQVRQKNKDCNILQKGDLVYITDASIVTPLGNTFIQKFSFFPEVFSRSVYRDKTIDKTIVSTSEHL